jgi:HEAT repeat protein
MRWKAARLLGEMRGRGVDLLMKALYDDDRGVRLLAAWALGKTGDIRAADALIRATPDDNDDVQLAIDAAIQRLSRACIVTGLL